MVFNALLAQSLCPCVVRGVVRSQKSLIEPRYMADTTPATREIAGRRVKRNRRTSRKSLRIVNKGLIKSEKALRIRDSQIALMRLSKPSTAERVAQPACYTFPLSFPAYIKGFFKTMSKPGSCAGFPECSTICGSESEQPD